MDFDKLLPRDKSLYSKNPLPRLPLCMLLVLVPWLMTKKGQLWLTTALRISWPWWATGPEMFISFPFHSILSWALRDGKGRKAAHADESVQKYLLSTTQVLCIMMGHEDTSQAQGFRAAPRLCEDPCPDHLKQGHQPWERTLWPLECVGAGQGPRIGGCWKVLMT